MDLRGPFPGMDPWLEPHWGDVHARVVMYAADHWQSRLPADLRARVEERVVIEAADEPVTETFVEVREARPSNRLVTVVEVLSPANRRAGDGQELYKQKQSELKRGGVSLVEIDLL